MTAAHPAATPVAGTRQRRRTERRRLVREQWLAVLVLLVAFIVTVVLLGLQWLDAGSGSASAVGSQHLTTLLEVL